MSEGLEWRWHGAVGEWCGRYTHSQDVPALATEALVAGWDARSLVLLAGEASTAVPADLGDLLVAAHLEMGRKPPTCSEGLLDFIGYLAWLTCVHQLSPDAGARRIESAALKLMEIAEGPGSEIFLTFTAFGDERSIGNRTDAELDEAILDEVRRLLRRITRP